MIGWAADSDAERIRHLLLQDGLDLSGGKWVRLAETWLVWRGADGVVQGCIAVHHGMPVARLDFLSVAWEVKGLSRVRVVKAILESAMAVVAQRGASFVTGLVPHYLPDYGDFLESFGGKKMNEGWMFVASLNEVLGKINDGRR